MCTRVSVYVRVTCPELRHTTAIVVTLPRTVPGSKPGRTNGKNTIKDAKSRWRRGAGAGQSVSVLISDLCATRKTDDSQTLAFVRVQRGFVW